MASFARLSLLSFARTMGLVVAGAALQRGRAESGGAVAVAGGPPAAARCLHAAEGPAPVTAALVVSAQPMVEAPVAPAATPVGPPVAEADLRDLSDEDQDWTPPSWFPEEGRDGLLALEGISQEGPSRGPGL